MNAKHQRQETLVALLESEKLSNQHEVVEKMRARGFDVTQPSISRDFRELGVVKLGGGYILARAGFERVNGAASVAGGRVRTVERAGPNLLVARTEIGAANVVALELDRQSLDGIAGTIAGDDTVFIATKNRSVQDQLIHRLLALSEDDQPRR
jgi:transcriptional regulator of arginine metabolism